MSQSIETIFAEHKVPKHVSEFIAINDLGIGYAIPKNPPVPPGCCSSPQQFIRGGPYFRNGMTTPELFGGVTDKESDVITLVLEPACKANGSTMNLNERAVG